MGLSTNRFGLNRPAFAKEQIPKDSRGRPLMTNNARIETMATLPTFRAGAVKGGGVPFFPFLGLAFILKKYVFNICFLNVHVFRHIAHGFGILLICAIK